MLPLLLFSVTCTAGDSAVPVDTAVQVQAQISSVNVQVDAQLDRMAGIEHFLADEARVKDGLAPRGWVQPALDAYLVPGVPESLIPGFVVTPIVTHVGPAGPTP